MKTKKLLATATLLSLIVFFTSLTLMWTISQATTWTPNETRKEAIVKTLSSRQLANGSFLGTYATNYGIPLTSNALTILAILKSLNRIDSEKSINYLVSLQNHTTGGFPDHWLIYGDVGTPFSVVRELKSVDSAFRLDPKLIDFVMQRYNETDGGFHEPTFELNGTKVAWTHFGMVFHGSWTDKAAYGRSNVITTFYAVDILSNLNALDRINKTKTVNWILSCRATNGGFGPFPNPQGDPFAPYLKTNPFTVDSYGAGVAYTYAALGALCDLDYSLAPEEREQTRNYILSSQHVRGCFVSIPEYAVGPANVTPEDDDSFFTYYAIMALYYLDAIDQSREQVAKAEQWLLSQQDFKNTYTYGLFYDWYESSAYDAVLSLNASGGLSLLDELTPRAVEQRTLFFGMSTALAFTTFVIAIATPYVVKWTRDRKQANETAETQKPETA